jgi:protein-tyrosine phosphatase
MRTIPPYSLWLGNALEGRDARRITAEGIEVVVDLAWEELPAQLPRDLVYLRVPLVDGSGNSHQRLRLVIETLAELLQAQIATLVVCSAGLSRSPAITAAAIARASQQSLSKVVPQLSRTGPCDLHPGLLADVIAVLDGQSKT